MRKHAVAVLAVVSSATLLAVVLGAPVGKAGRDALEGEWQQTVFEVDGAARDQPGSLRIVIKADVLTIHSADGETRTSKFKTDAGKTPAAIDLTPDYGVFKGRVLAGIYELEKDRLRICVIERDDRGRDPRDRATAFKTEPRDGLCLITLKRVK